VWNSLLGYLRDPNVKKTLDNTSRQHEFETIFLTVLSLQTSADYTPNHFCFSNGFPAGIVSRLHCDKGAKSYKLMHTAHLRC